MVIGRVSFLSAMTRSFLVVVRAVGGVAAPADGPLARCEQSHLIANQKLKRKNFDRAPSEKHATQRNIRIG
jgi:hypothetical protein